MPLCLIDNLFRKQNDMLRLNNGETNKCLPRVARGFTLIELLIVIVLMAIIAGMSAPAFIGMGRGAGMRGSVRSVCSTLSLLRQWAITHREEVTFHYFQGSDPGTATNASYYYAVNEFGTAIISTNDVPTLPMEVMFGPHDGVGNPYEVTFKTDGGLAPPVGSLTKHIYIRDRKFPDDADKGKTISINGLTGGILVE